MQESSRGRGHSHPYGHGLSVICVSLGLLLTSAGCGGDPNGDGCSGLDQASCDKNPSCAYYPGCPGCNGTTMGTCGVVQQGVANPLFCPAVACSACGGLDQQTCSSQPGCVADFCQTGCSCGGGTGSGTFVGCRGTSEQATGCPPSASCGIGCLPSCDGLPEATCKTTPQCVADYCQGCSCGPAPFAGCRSNIGPPTSCPALGCAPQCAQCSSLDEAGCAGASAQGCTIARCPACTGGMTFAACLDPGDPQPTCPADPCAPPPCHADSECRAGEVCVEPGEQICGGPCANPAPCQTDADCASLGPTGICDTPTCACSSSGKACVQGCTSDAGCGEGEACNAVRRCVPRSCVSNVDCPTHFTCVGGPAGSCQRQSCSVDGDCGAGGFCFKAACYAQPAMCTIQPV